MLTKKSLREKMKAFLATVDSKTRARKSKAIAEQFLQVSHLLSADVIFLYASLPQEVDTAPLIRTLLGEGKKIALPKIDAPKKNLLAYFIDDPAHQLKPGFSSILEPDPSVCKPCKAKAIDLCVVPGLAFDETGNRLGRGGGYYDRFLPQLRKNAVKGALCLREQVVKKVPVRAWDIPMDFLVTDQKIQLINS